MDAFYASVEQRDDPSLRGRPVAVGFGGKRGVVAAASYEARKFGVRSAMPSSTAKRLCSEIVFKRCRMPVYAEISAHVREIFYRYTPLIEPLSLDEAYLDVTGSLRLFGSAAAIAERIRREIYDELNLPCSVGGGAGKLVAKIASKKAKPDGLLIVPSEGTLAFLRPLRVSEIWGVGRVTEEKLLSMGIVTIGALADRRSDEIERELGSWGPLLQGLARGEDLRRVEGDRSRKSYGEENTFNDDVSEREVIEGMVIAHAETVARRLRANATCGRTVTLKYRPSTRNDSFRLVTRSRTLPVPTDDGPTVSKTAMALWDAEVDPPPIRLVGVQISGLDRDKPLQLSLFGESDDSGESGRGGEDRDRRRALNAALDDIVERFGSSAIKRGRSE